MPDTAETALEQTFADLANSRLRDKSPALLDYLQGFQLLKNNDDGSKAVGIFGFEIGDSWHYAPVFFFNGEIRGMDALYSVDSDLFVPLSEDWVNAVINRRPDRLGEVDNRSRDERGTRVPNYTRLRTIPSGGGSLSGFNKISADLMAPRESDPVPSLVDLLPEFGPKIATGFLEDVRRHPKLANLVQQYYDLADFETQLPKLAEKPEKVTIISSVSQAGAEKLTDSEKEKLVRGGLGVIDNRPDVEKAIVYTTKTKETMQNPGSGGLYEVLMADGSIKTLLVFSVMSGDSFLVYDPESGKHGILPGRHIWTIQQHDKPEFQKRLESESAAPSAVRPGDCVVFCNQNGDCTLGFEVEEANSSETDLKNLKVRASYWLDAVGCGMIHYSRMDYLTGPAPWRYGKPSERVRDIVVTEAGSGQIRYLAHRLVVNERRFRALILNRVKGNELMSYDPEIKFHLSDFGDHTTVRAALDKVASAVRVWSDGHEISVRDNNGSHQFTATNAVAYFIRKHACSVDDARLIVEEAAREATSYRIWTPDLAKQAANMMSFPDMPDETDGSEMSQFHRGQIPLSLTEKSFSDNNRPYYQYQSPFGGGTDEDSAQPDTMSTIQSAAQTGQKEVFDASVLSALIKNHNPTDLVDRFLPTIVAGMDRLGRLLFVLNWNYEEFQDKYGKDDLTEFSDNLRSTFEALGDLVLFMRKRTLAGDKEYLGLGLNAPLES